MPDAEVRVAEVKAFKTRSGNTRFVLVDDQGKEYSTFKESIAARLPGLEGRRARITFHEQQRDGFTNVYLDDVAALEDAHATGDTGERVDEVAWKTAVDAASYLLDESAVKEEVPEVRQLIESPPVWLEEWAGQIGAELEDGLREGPGWIAFAREDGTVYHTYTVMAPDPFVAPYYSFLLARTPKTPPEEVRAWRKDEYPD